MSQYNPNAVRRCVRRSVVSETKIVFKTKSFTQETEVDAHAPEINLESGFVSCTCNDFKYRHAAHSPNVNTPAHHCKHLVRAIANCARNGELVKQPEPELHANALAFFRR